LDPTPEEGLPEEVFPLAGRSTPPMNADLPIRDNLGRTPLRWRNYRFHGSSWHVPGGILRHTGTAADRIHAVPRLELRSGGAAASEPAAVRENVDRRARDRGLLVLPPYACRLPDPLDETRKFVPGEPKRNRLRWHTKRPSEPIAAQRRYEGLIGP
jgi:hypothetical protein